MAANFSRQWEGVDVGSVLRLPLILSDTDTRAARSTESIMDGPESVHYARDPDSSTQRDEIKLFSKNMNQFNQQHYLGS
jgi:hypothetical protein